MNKIRAVTLATLGSQDARAKKNFAHEPCAQCRDRPRVGTLSRCVVCLKGATNADRMERAEAEVRVSAREQRQAALEKLGDVFLEFVASPEGMRFVEGQQAELTAPRNDPAYLEALQSRDKDREAVANEITLIHHAVLWGRNRIGLTLRDDRNHGKAREVAGKLQQLFEAELLYEGDPHDKTKLADRTQKQPPKHEFGREKRSLGNDPQKRAASKVAGTRGRK
jgi:hypothetical protein